MYRSSHAVALIAVVAGLAYSAQADQHLSGSLGGTYTTTDEDIYVEESVVLVSDVTISVTNGRIIVDATSIDGKGLDGASGDSGYYDSSYNAHQPTAGDDGFAGHDLTLRTLAGGSETSDLQIRFETDLTLNGGSGGQGGAGANGGIDFCLEECTQYDSQPGAAAGQGGASGNLVIDSGGDVFAAGEWYLAGGSGGRGGDGGGVDIGQCNLPPGYMLAWGGKAGELGGEGGSVSLAAVGDILISGDLGVHADGGRGGDGGASGSNGSSNGLGGDGGQGGDAGTIHFDGANITPESSTEYAVSLNARSGLGGDGGDGGDGGADYSGCNVFGGCEFNEVLVRGGGSLGGHSGYSGNPGAIWMETPSGSGIISLVGVVAIARPVDAPADSGTTGYCGYTFGVTGDCAECGGYAAPRDPLAGAAGYPGGSGGTITFESYSLEIPGCELDVRGGKGSTGGTGGAGDVGGYLLCRGVAGGDGGTGGSGGNGGNIWYLTTYIDGAGGVARRCAGAGGTGGDGGCPDGSGGAGGSRGSIGAVHNLSSYGTAPSNMICGTPLPEPGADCP